MLHGPRAGRCRPADQRRIRTGPIAMGEDVARPQHGDDIGIARRRHADMGHQREPHRLGRFQRQFQRSQAKFAGHRTADPHLDADDTVAVGFDLGDARGPPAAFRAASTSPIDTPLSKPKMPGNEMLRNASIR